MPQKKAPYHVIVLFGCCGDLAQKKLWPALWRLISGRKELEKKEYNLGGLNESTVIVGFDKQSFQPQAFKSFVRKCVKEESEKPQSRIPDPDQNPIVWKRFSEQIHYHMGDLEDPRALSQLAGYLNKIEEKKVGKSNRLFFLAISVLLHSATIENMGKAKLHQKTGHGWVRLLVEKPFGKDLQSARELNAIVKRYFDEEQVFRIDHYLGKEATQNILGFRLGNSIFEPLWNRHYIDHVQITAAEMVGVGKRRVYEEMGALRDMVENHVLQLLCMIAMEPPVNLDADSIRDEKVKVLHSIKRQEDEEIIDCTQRGQYDEGFVGGETVPSYRTDVGIDASLRDTFAAWRLEIRNWRWAGVPFYLRSGKRMKEKVTEIAVFFKSPPVSFFPSTASPANQNVLVLTIQPKPSILLQCDALAFGSKQPIYQQSLRAPLKSGAFSDYEHVLLDALKDNAELFARWDEVEAAWEHVTRVLNAWRASPPTNFPNYMAGTWGPTFNKMKKENRHWRHE